jgi:hypothetical protein
MSRSQCLERPDSTGWETSGIQNGPSIKCQDRSAMEKYRSTFSGICYKHVPNCWGSVFKPPEPYKGWPPELCYVLNGMSYKKGPSPDVSCYARTFLERLVGNFGAPAAYHPDEVVVRGNCYIPSQSDDTVPLLSDY